MPTIEITTTDYGPQPSDDNAGAYLQRCGEELAEKYGYSCTLITTCTNPGDPEAQMVRQFQVTIPDEGANGGKRQVTITAPEVVVDLAGDVMSESTFNARYGSQ